MGTHGCRICSFITRWRWLSPVCFQVSWLCPAPPPRPRLNRQPPPHPRPHHTSDFPPCLPGGVVEARWAHRSPGQMELATWGRWSGEEGAAHKHSITSLCSTLCHQFRQPSAGGIFIAFSTPAKLTRLSLPFTPPLWPASLQALGLFLLPGRRPLSRADSRDRRDIKVLKQTCRKEAFLEADAGVGQGKTAKARMLGIHGSQSL